MTASVAYLARAAEARQNIPRVIRLLLALSGHPSKDLAEALGMPTSRLSERLTGKVRISSDELAACALFFDVDPGVFYRDPASFRKAALAGATVNEATVGLRVSPGQTPRTVGAAADLGTLVPAA